MYNIRFIHDVRGFQTKQMPGPKVHVMFLTVTLIVLTNVIVTACFFSFFCCVEMRHAKMCLLLALNDQK